MGNIQDITEALKRAEKNQLTPQDQKLLLENWGKQFKVKRQESVEIGGDVSYSVVNTGDHNVICTLTAEALHHLQDDYQPAKWNENDDRQDPSGQQPPGFYLPFMRNNLFTGRETDLMDLAKSLLGEKRVPRKHLLHKPLPGWGELERLNWL